MKDINALLKLYELKNVERMNSVKNRKESSAEHSWSCLILADYFLSKMKNNLNIDRLKVYELLMYHDVMEIEAGDTALHPTNDNGGQKEKEHLAFAKLKEEIPYELKEKYILLFNEYEEKTSVEARFATAIDKMDAIIHEIPYKTDWKGWSEEFLRKSKEKYFVEFPEIKENFETLMTHLRKEGYFSQ